MVIHATETHQKWKEIMKKTIKNLELWSAISAYSPTVSPGNSWQSLETFLTVTRCGGSGVCATGIS